MPWTYEHDEKPKRRHAWSEGRSGFVEVNGYSVGKCPNDVTTSEAELHLNAGVPMFPERWEHSWPKRIYVIFRQELYRATPTNPGVSYHAFPERPEEYRRLPRDTQKAILDLAKKLTCEEQIRQWSRS